MDELTLYQKIAELPDQMRVQVSTYMDFLLTTVEHPIKRKPVFGSAPGLFIMEPDFDARMEDLEPYSE